MKNKVNDIGDKLINSGRSAIYMNTIIHIKDNNTIELENCRCIMEYNDIFIKVKTANLIVQVWGKNLMAHDYNKDGITITGEILSVEFAKIQSRKSNKSIRR